MLNYKIANDYASNQDLVSLSQINNKWRHMIKGIELARVKSDYAALVNSGMMNATEIIKKFHHLTGRRTFEELANNHIHCMIRGLLDCNNTCGASCSRPGHFPYLIFLMRDVYLPNYLPSHDVQLKTIFFVFHNGTLRWLFCVNNADQTRINLIGTPACPNGEWIKTMRSIMNGNVTDMHAESKLILLDKPWVRQSVRHYGRDCSAAIPVAVMFEHLAFLFNFRGPRGIYLMFAFPTIAIVVALYVCFMYNIVRRARKR